MLLTITFIVGITAEAITAALSAGRMRMDWFGVIALGSITALGGGTIRDILLNNHPLTWVGEPRYLIITIVAALVTAQLSFLAAHFRRVFLTADAVGLAAFSVIGTQIAFDLGHGVVIAAVAATVTGVFGGVLRDILSDRVPLVFSQEIYAAVSILTAVLYWGLDAAGVPVNWIIVITLAFAFSSRMIAIKSHKNFPQYNYQGRETPVDPRLRLSAQLIGKGVRKAKRKAKEGAEHLRPRHRRKSRDHTHDSDETPPDSQ